MALNASGPISLAGTTVGQSIQKENGGNGTTQISLNDTAVRSLAGVPSGAITMPTNFYGKSNAVIVNLTISSNTANYNIYNNRGGSYVAGSTIINLTINSGVIVSSSSTGSVSLTVGGFATGDVVNIINNGTVKGAGGAGGAGGFSYNPNGGPGGAGGTAFNTTRAVSITNNGTFAGGGGGGAGGAVEEYCCCGRPEYRNNSGGGGGAGIISGAPGDPYSGNPGTANAGGGTGGVQNNNPPGGAGGNLGSAGQSRSVSGGAAGSCTIGNAYITWVSTGTRIGPLN